MMKMRRRQPKAAESPEKRSRVTLVTSLAAIAVAGIVVAVLSHTESTALASPQAPASVAASQAPEAAPRNQRRYRATRRLVVDRQTGQARMPTTEEVDELVANLTTLTKRADGDLPQTSAAGGGTAVDLDGGFAGVMLARPNDDGTYETRCVFTFDEGAEFLGLVEVVQ
jgi:hypothetical protein